jgi:hypothetical protein
MSDLVSAALVIPRATLAAFRFGLIRVAHLRRAVATVNVDGRLAVRTSGESTE